LNPTIFDVGVQGTLAAQTRIQSVAAGVVGFSTRVLDDLGGAVATPVFGLMHSGVRGPDPDLIILTQP
jgi:hypothetical protein